MTAELSQAQKKALAEAFQRLKSDQGTATSAPVEDLSSSVNFCKDWPKAKAVLLFLADIPGVPDILEDALKSSVRAGDTTYSVICPT